MKLLFLHKRITFQIISASLVVGVAALMQHVNGHYYVGLRSDPSYAYLFNGLSIVNHITPGHTDHPGTTVQELSGLMIFILWSMRSLFISTDALTRDVLQHPEIYLRVINGALLALTVVAVLIAADVIRRVARNGLWALILPALMLTSPSLLDGLSMVAAEPMLIPLSLASALLATLIETGSDSSRRWTAMLLGAALAAGIVTKITFLPMLALLIVVPTLACLAIALGVLVVTLAVLTIPIWPVLGRMFEWQRALLTHQGVYGSGAEGLPPVGVMIAAARDLIVAEPLLPLCAILATIEIMVRVFNRAPSQRAQPTMKMLVATVCIIVMQIAMVSKHSSPHYLLAVIPLAAYSITSQMPFKNLFSWNRRVEFGSVFLSGAVVVAFFMLVDSAVRWGDIRLDTTTHEKGDYADLIHKAQNYNCNLISYYTDSNPIAALVFGNSFASRSFSAILDQIYPGTFYYNLATKKPENFADSVTFETVEREGHPTCLIGSVPSEQMGGPHVPLALIASQGMFYLYEMK